MATDAKGEASALHELQSALHSYLSLGTSTPLYHAAESFSTEVTHALSQSGSSDPTEKPDHEGGSDGESSPPSNFRNATHAAKAVYGNESNDGPTKTEDSAQSDEDEEKKKKGSRPF